MRRPRIGHRADNRSVRRQEEVRTEDAILRFVDLHEKETLLHYNGFAIRDAYGDWDRQPLTNAAPWMIHVCQLLS